MSSRVGLRCRHRIFLSIRQAQTVPNFNRSVLSISLHGTPIHYVARCTRTRTAYYKYILTEQTTKIKLPGMICRKYSAGTAFLKYIA